MTFNSAKGNVDALKGLSDSGVTVQSRTLTEGIPGNTREVQVLTFVTTGPLIAAITLLRDTLEDIPSTVPGRDAINTAVIALSNVIAARNNLGKIIGDEIKQKMGLPDSAFALTIDYVDADTSTAGFQAAAVVKLDINKSVTKTLGFDFNLPDLGPITVGSDGNISVTVSGDLDLDFGFRFGTFTPYLLNTTSVSLSSSINSNISVTAGIGGISGGLSGQLRLRGSTITAVNNGVTQFQMPAAPQDNMVIVTRNGVLLRRGTLLTDVDTDYIVDASTNPVTLRFKTATTAGTQVEYATNASPANASVGITIDPALVPSDGNTIGGIPFSQIFSTSIPVANKFDFNLNGIAMAALEANLLGTSVDDAITVAVGLSNPTLVELRFEGVSDFLGGLTDLGSMNLQQLIAGARELLTLIESGLKSDLLEKLPLIGDGLDLGATFIGKLKTMIDQLEDLLDTASGSVNALQSQIQSTIFNTLGRAARRYSSSIHCSMTIPTCPMHPK